ncbi:alpha-galactosidase [Bacillus pinisoli]|uniref:alpha-galactosidase n=1 Tax=Bacillus pinisoli TaxID=2901866 RepID=UPI001FF457C7|nr:alpha-galactosidase [Bacillus pinisoli]
MPIHLNEELKQFHLQSKDSSYIFTVLRNGQLGQLYYGKRIEQAESFSHLLVIPNEPIGNATFPFEGDDTFSLEAIKQEFPSYGTTDFREPALHLWQEDGSRITNFVYESYKLMKGKPGLTGLPATYVEHEDEAHTLCITLKDEKLASEIDLLYTVYEQENVITRSAQIRNNGKQDINIERFLSAVIDLPTSEYEMCHLDGAWIRERHVTNRLLARGVQYIDSKRGTSSSQHNPFLVLKAPHTTEHSGEVYGFSLIYSGNFLAGVEVDHYDTARVFMGINPFDFRWNLRQGQTFQAPEVVMVYSDEGLNKMSQTYHRLYRTRLARGEWRDKERPVLINNWEATYFQFNEEKLLAIGDAGKELGIDLFVLDDGWFEGRNNDRTSLGDWFVDLSKLPNGLEKLASEFNKRGLSFGLWFEPEMISEKSKLYEMHPDWVLNMPGRLRSHGRHQFILDLTRKEVRDYIYERVAAILSSTNITYVKWDMNRNMTEIGSVAWGSKHQGEIAHRYILGLYELLDRITTGFPHVLFESCASGGNRFDPGMLYYMPQAWASDNTDAIERLKIQYGTSYVYPLSSIGAHVSAIPNHQVGRTVPLHTRFAVAMFGVFGYELDATKFTEEEKEIIKCDIAFYKENRKLLQQGTFYRLKSPFEQNDVAWMVISEDQNEVILGYYRILAKPNPGFERVRLKGLSTDKKYEIKGMNLTLGGDELMNAGFILPPFYTGTVQTAKTNKEAVGDFQGMYWKLEALN